MVREVNEMVSSNAQVHAWCDGSACTIECTVCGPLGVVSQGLVDLIAVGHMQDVHGAEVVLS